MNNVRKIVGNEQQDIIGIQVEFINSNQKHIFDPTYRT